MLNIKQLIASIFCLGNEDSTEPMDSTGSSQVLNAASYVLSSQIGEKVNVTVNISSIKGIYEWNLIWFLHSHYFDDIFYP